jgi:phenol 2-monooxygenase
MQFYLNGYQSGNPDIQPQAPKAVQSTSGVLPETVDVLIIGSGPAGTLLAAQLSRPD